MPRYADGTLAPSVPLDPGVLFAIQSKIDADQTREASGEPPKHEPDFSNPDGLTAEELFELAGEVK